MSEAFRVGLIVDGDASRGKAAVVETTTALKGLTGAAKEASAAAASHGSAVATEAAAVARLSAAEANAARAVTTAMQAQINALTGVSTANGEVRASSAQASAAVFEEAEAFARLTAALQPALTNAERYALIEGQVKSAVAAGIATKEEGNRVLALAKTRYLEAGQAAQVMARETQNVGGAAGISGAKVQNAAFQIGDFAVQVAAGTSATRALGMQLPQLLGGFGVWGAVIGAAVAVGGALIPVLFDMSDGIEEVTNANDAFADSFGSLRDEFSTATSLHAEYVAAMLAGNAELMNAIELEAKARQAQFELDRIGLEESRKAAKAAQDERQADMDKVAAKGQQIAAEMAATEARLAEIRQAGLGEGNLLYTETLGLLQNQRDDLTQNLELQKQQRAELDKASAEYAVINAQVGVLEARLRANGDLISIVKDGVAGTSDELDRALGPANLLGAYIGDAWDAMIGLDNAAPGDGWLGSAIGQADTLAAKLWDAVVAADAARTTNPTVTRLPGGVDAIASGDISITSGHAHRIAPPQTTGTGGGGGAAPEDAIASFLAKQQEELDLLRETDPVQKEMIRNREMLAGATDEQRKAVEAAIRAGIAEKAQIEGLDAAWDMMGQSAEQALEDIFLSGKKAGDVIADLGKQLAAATLKAAILGEGPLAGLMGTATGGGIFGSLRGSATGGILGALFGMPGKAGGGLLSGTGTGTSDDIPIWASDGEFIVNARATAQNLPLLEAINSGAPFPAAAPGFAQGGLVSGRNDGGSYRASGAGPTVVHNHFNITTPNARSFAEDRVSVARGASRLVAQAGRYS